MDKLIKSGSGLTKPARAFTHRFLESLVPGAAPYRVSDSRTADLAVRVAVDGRISWDCSYRISGTNKVRRVSLGAWPGDATLEAARDRANELTRAARAGRDLLTEEEEAIRQRKSRISVGQLVDEYVKRRIVDRCRTSKEIESRLKRALGTIASRPADEIRRRDIRALLDACSDQGFKREAEQRRCTITAMCKWAVSADLLETDFSAGLPKYEGGAPRNRILTAEEIRVLWPWFDSSGMPSVHADVLRLCLLLGARCGEVAGIQFNEINATNRLWTLPPERSKNGQVRVTPLVGIAWGIIERRVQIRTSLSLFPTEDGKPLKASHVGNILNNRDLPVSKFVTHDLRRTVASGMVDLGISLETTAAVLGHAVGGSKLATLRRHYVHTDFVEAKRKALTAWSQHIAWIVSGAAVPCNVLPLIDAHGSQLDRNSPVAA